MSRFVGTVVRGLRAPIIKQSDDIQKIAISCLLNASKEEGFSLKDGDILAITESIVARAQGNYAHVEHIATEVRKKFPSKKVGVLFPILSRNRFAICLRGIAMGTEEVILQFNYPTDEVGNSLVSKEVLFSKHLNPFSDCLSEEEFRKHFGHALHPFTGVDYINYYKELIEATGAKCTLLFSNHPAHILEHTKDVLNCDIHTRKGTKEFLQKNGANVHSLDDFLTTSNAARGYNPQYGLLGSNKATEDTIKLFPRDCDSLVRRIQTELHSLTGKRIEVMVYGDGAFKDPVGQIWELADPVVSPGYTAGLSGTPNELKLKYLADNDLKDLRGEELKLAMIEKIKTKDKNLVGNMAAQGTTPRQLTDLIGSLCDLTSGSGDKGTPIIYIQGYFDNYANE